MEYLTVTEIREKDVFRRAALALHMIAVDHPFFDGNKRTAFATAENELGDAGYYINAEAEEIIDLMRKIAEYKCSLKAIEKRIKKLASSHIG